jgi:trimethylamine--corrinoid protein Co-methyltransferase
MEKVRAMASGYLTFLSKEEIGLIHENSLKVLQEVGLRIYSKKVQGILKAEGAECDASSNLVRIPASMVEDAIKKAPKEITLCGREHGKDVKLPTKGFPFATLSGFSVFMRDMETGEKRATRSSDLKNFAVLGDYLDAVDFFWPIVTPTEVPPPIQAVQGLAVSFENTGKHVQYQALSEDQAKWQIRLASAIVGDEETLRKKPIFSSVQCSVSPLQFERESSEAMVKLARAGIPISPMSMALGGVTAPITLAGTLVTVNAEELGALTIAECANSGSPLIYCVESTPANMWSGEINYQAPEIPFISAGCAQMARFYGLPCQVAQMGMDETPPDLESLNKYTALFALNNMCRTDITGGFGSLEAADSAALEQVVLDVEAWGRSRAFLRSFEVNEETLAFDTIRDVGPGGTFLAMKHTIEHFRREIWLRKSSDTVLLGKTSGGSLADKAKAKVKEILSAHQPPQIGRDVKNEMNSIMEDCRKALF